MKTFYFCARNVEDYLKHVNTVNAQNFFASTNSVYADGEKFLNASVTNQARADFPDVKFDFNYGLRLEIPQGNWHVTISDFDSDLIFFDKDISDVKLISVEKYFIRWHIEIFRDGKIFFTHTFNLRGKSVLIHFPNQLGMGDIISMLPYVEDFRRRHNCKIFMAMPDYLREFTEHVYPKFAQVSDIIGDYYVTFQLAMPLNKNFPLWQTDVRNYPMGRIAGVALGSNKIAPKNYFNPTQFPVMREPYVCIAVQASTTSKGWLYPEGWNILVKYLKSLGYRVFCIDKDKEIISNGITIEKPEDAEDFTGNFPIMARANMLYHAEFFIGLGSGLAWLADAVDCPTVLISGFSQDWSEFYTPYRVTNRLVCNGCFNDVRVNFIKEVCPYHKNTPRESECQKKISPKQVIDAVERLIINEGLIPPILRND